MTSKSLLVMESVDFLIETGWTVSVALMVAHKASFDENWCPLVLNILFNDGPKIFDRVVLWRYLVRCKTLRVFGWS